MPHELLVYKNINLKFRPYLVRSYSCLFTHKRRITRVAVKVVACSIVDIGKPWSSIIPCVYLPLLPFVDTITRWSHAWLGFALVRLFFYVAYCKLWIDARCDVANLIYASRCVDEIELPILSRVGICDFGSKKEGVAVILKRGVEIHPRLDPLVKHVGVYFNHILSRSVKCGVGRMQVVKR